MNLKAKAARDVVLMVLLAITVSFSINFILATVPLQTIGLIAGGVFVVYMLYMVYSIRLGQLEYREKLKEMVDNR